MLGLGAWDRAARSTISRRIGRLKERGQLWREAPIRHSSGARLHVVSAATAGAAVAQADRHIKLLSCLLPAAPRHLSCRRGKSSLKSRRSLPSRRRCCVYLPRPAPGSCAPSCQLNAPPTSLRLRPPRPPARRHRCASSPSLLLQLPITLARDAISAASRSIA